VQQSPGSRERGSHATSLQPEAKRNSGCDVNPAAWLRAEVLHAAWKRGLYRPPDRRFLEDTVLRALADNDEVQRVLFVGVQWYTARYAQILANKQFATIDPAANVATFGGEPHAIGYVQDLHNFFTPGQFDAIVMSGVIGFGLNDPRDVDRALGACRLALRDQGWLIIGVNELKPTHVDPAQCPESHGFEPTPFGPVNQSRVDLKLPFRERRHSFLFWKKRPAQAQ